MGRCSVQPIISYVNVGILINSAAHKTITAKIIV